MPYAVPAATAQMAALVSPSNSLKNESIRSEMGRGEIITELKARMYDRELPYENLRKLPKNYPALIMRFNNNILNSI